MRHLHLAKGEVKRRPALASTASCRRIQAILVGGQHMRLHVEVEGSGEALALLALSFRLHDRHRTITITMIEVKTTAEFDEWMRGVQDGLGMD